MNNDLAPTHRRMFSPYTLLWYTKSNTYSIVESEFEKLLDTYFESTSIEDFCIKIGEPDGTMSPVEIAANIKSYLDSCNVVQKPSIENTPKFKTSNRNISNQYLVKDQNIQIFYDSELVEKILHPAIAHLEVKHNGKASKIFDVYLENDYLCLFKNEKLVTSVPKRDYHLLQGKFFMQLLSEAYDKVETDWIGTFHGSTIADGDNSILIVGKSGKGKSTLCAILAANGLELVADDVSPMLSKDSHIYHNPSALSIKKGAFDTLGMVVDKFDNLPITYFNKSKGALKYIPFRRPKNDHYPCKAVILVNYKKDSDTILENISIKRLLEILIPDSWLSPNPYHAKQFIEWLWQINAYQLTYSDTKSVVRRFTVLFDELKG